MKRIINYLLVGIFTFSFWNCVSATTYQTNELIPVDSLATVETESFTYQNFIYYSSVNASKKSTLNFESVKNKSEKKLPVSINLLLFDENKKNVGYLTYCTDKDYDTDWAKYKLVKGANIPFSISVSKKYFTREDDIYHVKYIAVQDENPYCKVGGYSKYDGLTIEQITKGDVATEKEAKGRINDIFKIYENTGLVAIIIMIVALFVVYLIIGSVLNALYKRMYAKATALAYLPIASNYVSVKLAFGNIVAIGYLASFVLAFALSFIGVGFLTSLVNFVSLVSFIIVIVKLITKKYDLFYFEPSIRNANYNNDLNQSAPAVNNNINNNNNDAVSNEVSTPISGGEVVDLSYSNVDGDSIDISDGSIDNFSSNLPTDSLPTSNLNDISSGSGPLNNNQIDSLFGETNENNNSSETDTTSENDNQGDSDLSKFFR